MSAQDETMRFGSAVADGARAEDGGVMHYNLYWVVPIAQRADDGEIVADEAGTFELPSAEAAIAAAEAVASYSAYCGAVAFARAFNQSHGCYGPVEVLTRCGNIHWSASRGTWVA